MNRIILLRSLADGRRFTLDHHWINFSTATVGITRHWQEPGTWAAFSLVNRFSKLRIYSGEYIGDVTIFDKQTKHYSVYSPIGGYLLEFNPDPNLAADPWLYRMKNILEWKSDMLTEDEYQYFLMSRK